MRRRAVPRIFGIVCLLFFLYDIDLCPQTTIVHDSDVYRVMALETLWNQAEVARDTLALTQLVADNFVYVDIDGSLKNKAEFLATIKNAPERIETLVNDSMVPRVYEDTIIVSGTYRERGMLNGKPYSRRGRFTDTWVRQGSSWICVASQSTLMSR
jgi:ketosteroid isomerase-like protein